MDALLERSDLLVSRVGTKFKRYLYYVVNWENRLIGIKGARGTGKTTLVLQHLHELGKPAHEAAYFSLDDLFFSAHSFMETAEAFYKQGGKYLFLDEVHKYPGWARVVKNLYDFYPDLHIVFTGSSIIDIAKEEADLSRRAMMHELKGLSFREFLVLRNGKELPKVSFKQLLDNPSSIRKLFDPGFRPLQYLNEYLSTGYYPFFKEDFQGYHLRLQQLIRLVVEYDMAELHDFDIRNAKKMLQLLYILAENVPFKPNLTKISQKSNIHRNSINSYLYYLEQAHLISQLYPSGISTAILQKPEKIYLNNANLAYALSIHQPDKDNLRETFFLNQLQVSHRVHYPLKGDFIIDGTWIFEIGGKNKKHDQIKSLEHAFVVQDDVEYPVSLTLPLWLFGFLY
jgi:predicted AAA+ superfamily ATPase